MLTWRFYEGLRGEWRWYALDAAGNVIVSADSGFAELSSCMENASRAGFDRTCYHVHTRSQPRPDPKPVRDAGNTEAIEPSTPPRSEKSERPST